MVLMGVYWNVDEVLPALLRVWSDGWSERNIKSYKACNGGGGVFDFCPSLSLSYRFQPLRRPQDIQLYYVEHSAIFTLGET